MYCVKRIHLNYYIRVQTKAMHTDAHTNRST